ncbi:hypothetical protein FRACA_1370008 [Frankia canadensis]|uniref:Uncharacterized protein n=1 Tax=Frankia canadensis TaxID=1836972 RepID=A0A2I2KL00_9ACTN|nr:hypothetical protein FRACA_1370008 [Frankia canadensis]SOU53639.1 hypothetical protein FRACA_1370008 [Frankia canadensis]
MPVGSVGPSGLSRRRDQPGVRIEDDWDGMGQRTTARSTQPSGAPARHGLGRGVAGSRTARCRRRRVHDGLILRPEIVCGYAGAGSRSALSKGG